MLPQTKISIENWNISSFCVWGFARVKLIVSKQSRWVKKKLLFSMSNLLRMFVYDTWCHIRHVSMRNLAKYTFEHYWHFEHALMLLCYSRYLNFVWKCFSTLLCHLYIRNVSLQPHLLLLFCKEIVHEDFNSVNVSFVSKISEICNLNTNDKTWGRWYTKIFCFKSKRVMKSNSIYQFNENKQK